MPDICECARLGGTQREVPADDVVVAKKHTTLAGRFKGRRVYDHVCSSKSRPCGPAVTEGGSLRVATGLKDRASAASLIQQWALVPQKTLKTLDEIATLTTVHRER